MVRLVVPRKLVSGRSNMFQFQCGAIGRKKILKNSEIFLKFQFQCGAIGRVRGDAVIDL